MAASLKFFAQIRMLQEGEQKGRLYLHNSGILSYGTDPVRRAKTEFNLATTILHSQGKHYPWVIGILWGKGEEPIVDLFVYSGLNGIMDWPGNPDVDYGHFQSGKFTKDAKGLTCGDGLVALGKEENYRRTCRSLEHYLAEAPPFPVGDIKIRL